MPKRNIIVIEASGRPIDELPFEMTERKGLGHPDTLCDLIAERVSRDYGIWCEENIGQALHHDFDQVTLVAGEVDLRFGGGEAIKPIHISITGRAVAAANGRIVPVETIAIEAAKAQLRETLRHLDPDRHCVIECATGRDSASLADIFPLPIAGDTSFGAANWPRSTLESLVYETAQYANHELCDNLPVGEDVKVMGFRQQRNITLTVALPFLCREVGSAADYAMLRDAAIDSLRKRAQSLAPAYAIRIDLNPHDNPARGDVSLTLTGTSAEMGHDGAVGRGNRVTGLSSPFRPSGLDAAAGRNPINHVGKLYNLMSLIGAQEIVTRIPALGEAQVFILSQIGKPVDQPLGAAVVIRGDGAAITPDLKIQVAAVLEAQLQDVKGIQARLRTGTLAVC